jgi:hypothetical protein
VSALYRVVAANRRVLAVPAGRAGECACEPDDRRALRAALVGTLLAFGAAAAAAFGAAFLPAIGRAPRGGLSPALAGVAIAGAGPALAALLVAFVPRGRRSATLAHLSATTAAGAAVLLPTPLLALFAPALLVRAAGTVSVATSFVLMLGMARKRARYLGLSRRHVSAWAAALAASACALWLLLLE